MRDLERFLSIRRDRIIRILSQRNRLFVLEIILGGRDGQNSNVVAGAYRNHHVLLVVEFILIQRNVQEPGGRKTSLLHIAGREPFCNIVVAGGQNIILGSATDDIEIKGDGIKRVPLVFRQVRYQNLVVEYICSSRGTGPRDLDLEIGLSV